MSLHPNASSDVIKKYVSHYVQHSKLFFTESRGSVITTSISGEVDRDSTNQKQNDQDSDSGTDPATELILNSDALKQHFVVMERVVTENVYQQRQALYRGLPVIPG